MRLGGGRPAALSAVTFGLGLAAIVAGLAAHHPRHLPNGTGSLYVGTVIASSCFAMIGVALGSLTRNPVGAIVAVIAWTLLLAAATTLRCDIT